MDPALHELLRSAEADADEEVEALIRLRRPDDRVPGVRLVARFGPIATCRIKAVDIRSVWRHPAVRSLKAPRSYRPEQGMDDDHPGHPPAAARPEKLTGAGVIVGVVDWSLDFAHPEFLTPQGRSRVLMLWDQGARTARPPKPYGYGRLHTRSEIDAALRTPAPYKTLGYHPAVLARKGRPAHGTHVASIAAGSSLPGAAHGADLVFVHLADRNTSGLANMGDSVRLLEGIDLIRRTAARRGQPWVVNLSMGRQGGPKDGLTLLEMALDRLLSETRDCCIVGSAGNYYLSGGHSAGRVGPGEIRAIRFQTSPGDQTPNEVEVWYDGADRLDVRLTPPRGVPGAWVSPDRRLSVKVKGSEVGRIYHRAHDPNNGDNQVDAFLDVTAPAGQWTLELRGTRVRNGRFHAWIERDDLGQTRFVERDRDRRSTIGTIASGRLPICVGAVAANESGPMSIWAKSSAGPTRDGRKKPFCCVRGEDVRGARSAPLGSSISPGKYVTMSGTSMAAPAVTAAVARILQAQPGLDIRQIRRLVLGATRPGPQDPDGRAGVGHLDPARLTATLSRRSEKQFDADDAPNPKYVEYATSVWKDLKLPARAKIHPLDSAPSEHIRESNFKAWTNSATDVYVTDLKADDDAWEIVLFHEAEHVRQFTRLGRPTSYRMMMLFEQEAYAKTARWAKQRGLDEDYERQMSKSSKEHGDEIERVRKLPWEAQERAFCKFLSLPPHRKIADLYEVWPPKARVRRTPGSKRQGGGDSAEFAGQEHKDIGNTGAGSVGPTTLVFEGSPQPLSFGEVVALAGDYFASYDQMVELSRSSSGRAQLAHARWLATAPAARSTRTPEPTGDAAVIKVVRDRAARLAATNVSHFSADGANWRMYSSWHAQALADAVGSGPDRDDRLWRQALSKEAFGLHFLTDAFSAGHVRTPRGEIQTWYSKRYPGSKPLIDYLARFMYDGLVTRNRIPASGLWFPGEARKRIADQIRELAGAAADSYSLGDIVSLALHDFDGCGLNVVSDRDSLGRAVPGGYRWRAVGDGRLPEHPPGRAAQSSAVSAPKRSDPKPADETWRMVVAAVKASMRELRQVRVAGLRAGAADLSAPQRSDVVRGTLAAEGTAVFAARFFVPREDPGKNPALRTADGTKAPLDWHWKRLGPTARAALDQTMRKRVPLELAPLVETTADLDHRAVLTEFVQHLRDNGILVLEKIYADVPTHSHPVRGVRVSLPQP